MKIEESADKTGAASGGFVLHVSGSKRPGFRWEAAPNRLRLVIGNEARLWARSELNWWQPPWFAHCLDRQFPPVITPIHTNDLQTIRSAHGSDDWWRAWQRWFVKELASSVFSPLYDGVWRLARLQMGPIDKAPAWGYLPWDGVPIAHSLGTVHGHWGIWCSAKERSAQGEVVMLRAMTSADLGRVKMWKKRALEDRLPPILLTYCAPIGIHVLIDGHARLQAALEAGKTPQLLVLVPVQAKEKRHDDEWRKASIQQAEMDAERFATLGQRGVDLINANLIDAFDERPVYTPKARAWPLAGSIKAWEHDVEAAMRGMSDSVICALRDEMLGNGKIGGRMVNRERQWIARLP